MKYHLAQLNIARMKFDLDSPEMKDFVDGLDPVNAIADNSPGFVWRLQSDEGNATNFQIFEDPEYIVNISVWASLDAFNSFVRSKTHLEVMKRRREWFEVPDQAYLVLWWVPAGHRPTVAEAQQRLESLRANGPSAFAFSFASAFPPPEIEVA